MGNATVGEVVVTAKVENLADLFSVQAGTLPPERVRRLEVSGAVVNTGASMLGMPRPFIVKLGLQPYGTRRVRTAAGTAALPVYQAVRLTVAGRDCNCDVMEVPDACPVLIGQIPLELMDLVVDPSGQRLIGNPAHGGEHVVEMY